MRPHFFLFFLFYPNNNSQTTNSYSCCKCRHLLANFLYVLQLAVPSILSVLPHERTVVITRQQQTGRPCSLHDHEQTELPLYGVLCLDWITWAGISENVFSLSLCEKGEERDVSLIKHCITVIAVGTRAIQHINKNMRQHF